MYFKNLAIYNIIDTIDISNIEEQLKKHEFTKLGAIQESTFGWVPTFKDSICMAGQVAGMVFIAARVDEKILPASVVNDHLTEKMDEIEKAEGRRPGKKEREQLKEDIRSILLPRAFHKSKRVSAWIDLKNKRLVVNASSENVADDFTANLREAIGSLPIIPFMGSRDGSQILTDWYKDPTARPNGIELDADLKLSMVQDPTVKAAYKNLDIEAGEINLSLESGMRIKQIHASHNESIHFTINEKFQIKAIKYDDKLVEQANDSDDPRSDAILMIDSINSLINVLGEDVEF